MFGFTGRQADGLSGTASIGGWIRGLGLPLGFGSTQWLGFYQGHEIRVVTHGPLRARLYIDGVLRDKRSPVLCADREVPLLGARLPSPRHDDVIIVEVRSRALWASRIEVSVAGKPVSVDSVTGPCP